MERKIYSPWAFTGNEKEKSKINYEIFKELKQKYRITQIDLVDGVDLNFDDYDVIIGRKACYCHSKYKVYKNTPKLSDDELALLCDDGNLCFGYTYEGECNGIKCFRVSED